MYDHDHICAEIAYGRFNGLVHSDICVTVTSSGISEKDKTFLRLAFEEFLSHFKPHSENTPGYFHVNGKDAFSSTSNVEGNF